MDRSFLVLIVFLLFSNAILAQEHDINLNPFEDSSLSLGGIHDPNGRFLYLGSQNRSSIRATIDTMKLFGISNGAFRQTIESQFRFDANFNLVFVRHLNYSISQDKMNLAREIVVVYNNENLLTSDTTYLFNSDGQKLLNSRRSILYDGNGNWNEILEEKWDPNFEEWIPETKIIQSIDGDLVKRTRNVWNSSLSAFTSIRVDEWHYNANGEWIIYEIHSAFIDSLILTNRITRDYLENGNLISQQHRIASSPDFILAPFQKVEYTYDTLDRFLTQVTSVRETEGTDEWRNSVQIYNEYNVDNTIDQQYRSTWSQSFQDWEIIRRSDYEYNSLKQKVLTEEFVPISVELGIWSLDRTIDETIDASYEPGTFIASSDVSSVPYMITDVVVKTYRPDEALDVSQHWIYKEVETSSVVETEKYPIEIYPNPFDSNIFIDLKDIQIPVSSVEVFNNSGVFCFSKPISQNTELQVAHLMSGNYILVIKGVNGEVLQTRKMIKSR